MLASLFEPSHSYVNYFSSSPLVLSLCQFFPPLLEQFSSLIVNLPRFKSFSGSLLSMIKSKLICMTFEVLYDLAPSRVFLIWFCFPLLTRLIQPNGTSCHFPNKWSFFFLGLCMAVSSVQNALLLRFLLLMVWYLPFKVRFACHFQENYPVCPRK